MNFPTTSPRWAQVPVAYQHKWLCLATQTRNSLYHYIYMIVETILDYDSIIPASEWHTDSEALVGTMSQMDSVLYDAVIIKINIHVLEEIEDTGSLSILNELTATNRNSTVLHLACQYGSIRCVEHILSVHKSLLLKINSRGENVLNFLLKEKSK